MTKRVLIISPYFPPVNAADMHRVRTSLPYFKENGWDAKIVMVDEHYADMATDDLLLASLPDKVEIIKVKALSKYLTRIVGLGSTALRSFFYYRQTVDRLLSREHFDLVYFSTTQFPVCALGRHWKQRFGVPYIIDMQDPWYTHSNNTGPKRQLQLKQRLMYEIHKRLERTAMSETDGLISVSASYIEALKKRYASLEGVPSSVITFGSFERDLQTAVTRAKEFPAILKEGHINIVYIGRGGPDMHKAISPIFAALKQGMLTKPQVFGKLRLYFIGTSYAPPGTGTETILPLAKQYAIQDLVTEVTDRISYYHTLVTLLQADALFIPGSDDAQYTASKLFPYLLSRKPLMAVFHEKSSVVDILDKCTSNVNIFTFGDKLALEIDKVFPVLESWANNVFRPLELKDAFDNYSARKLTARQTDLFNQALNHFETRQ